MGLKIERIDENGVTGVLDGVLNFEVSRSGEGVTACIHNWRRYLSHSTITSLNCMRAAAYEALARYREEQRLV